MDGLENYTDSELVEELKRRGYEVIKWPPDDWDEVDMLHNESKQD